MLGSYRGEHAKTGLTIFAAVAALAFGLWIIASGLSRDADYQRQADDRSREYAAYTQEQIRQNCVPLAPQDKADCVAKERYEYRQDRREERDLVAQRKSANWAFIMGAAAVLGMVLSAVGVALVWTTFRETRRANEIAKSTFEHQSRPWVILEVSIVGLALLGDDFRVEIDITCKNVGQSPANYLSVCPAIEVEPMSSPLIFNRTPLLFDAEEEAGLHDVTLFHGQEWEYTCVVEGLNAVPRIAETHTACLVIPIRYQSPAEPRQFHYTVLIFDLVDRWSHGTEISLSQESLPDLELVERRSMASTAW